MEPTNEVIEYARTYLECKLKQHWGWRIADEDLKDEIQYGLRKLVLKWRKHYDPLKSKWKTFVVTVCRCTVIDCIKHYWRQHQRLQTIPLDDLTDTVDRRTEEKSVEEVIDEIFEDPVVHDVALMKWQGHTQAEICRRLRITKQQYVAALARIHGELQKRTKVKQ